jgi:hypothetical protein
MDESLVSAVQGRVRAKRGRGGGLVVVAAIAVVALAVAGSPGGQGASGSTANQTASDDQRIRETVGGGLDFLQRGLILVTDGQSANGVSDAALQARSAALRTLLAKYFVGTQLDQFTEALQAAAAAQLAGGERDVAGGVKQLVFDSVNVRGDIADVKARALIWIQSASVRGGPPEPAPEGWWTYELSLSKGAARWRISEFQSDPGPGSAP